MSPTGATDPRWWRHAVIYQVYVRSFADSDGDGIGDLPGIRSRLGHLARLGVDALWITPFYPSPMADGGYDVADPRGVDPVFGTLDDARGLVADAHSLGLRVIVDIVPNHTSAAHPWFQEALTAAPGSPERGRYLFRPGRGDGPPNDWESVFGGPAWTGVADGEWYLHLFDASQPDVDWSTPEVRTEYLAVLRFWLDLGVDGFRIDVAHGLVKADGLPDAGDSDQHGVAVTQRLPYFDQEGVHEIYRSWRAVLDSYSPPRVAVAEAWTRDPARTARYVRPDELHQAFNFHYLRADWSATDLRAVIVGTLAATSPVGAPATWVLSNHDVQRHVTRYGDGPLGLRRARAALLLTLALPGSVYLYQGEELGLPEVLDLPESVLQDPIWRRSGFTERGRDGCRVPIPWTREGSALGFGPSGSRPWLPQPDGWSELSVEAQTGDPRSLLELYRTALRLRRDVTPEADLEWLESGPELLVFRHGNLGCAVNFGPAAEVTVSGPLLLTSEQCEVDGTNLLLPQDTAAWWSIP
ncbi:glycoside hydrolase family 13 protein [Actinokineospora cianjurensis]|uniref:Alpha-glucosidase n=1 Tax=Actinokineospora cianjurensis TaxID=585224 RepID=A0A421AVZ3_9PSEU|nr:alpha-amylase family glycosyl hydrolase [Actinokineospora cianjurensis]RLK53782.1 alpha-glucosidase [Actinokineospora cianjurensis]